MTPALHVESTGAGAPLVLLHGWAMHSGLWGPLAATLAPRFRVHAVDLPGHGHSAPVAPFTLDTVTAAVAAAFDSTREPLTVVGWSLGGTVALHWARAAPERIARLVLVATTPSFVARDDWPHAMAGETLARFGDELSRRTGSPCSGSCRCSLPAAPTAGRRWRRCGASSSRAASPRRRRWPRRWPRWPPPTCAPSFPPSRNPRWWSPASATPWRRRPRARGSRRRSRTPATS